MDLQQADEYVKTYVTDIENIFRTFARRWSAEEQVDNTTEDEIIKRYFIGYDLAEENKRANVFMVFWYGGSGEIVELRDGRAVNIKLHPMDYPVTRINIECIPEGGEDFLIDSEHLVHSVQEMSDRMMVMWNSDHWQVKNDHIADNARLYRQYVPLQGYFKKSLPPLIAILQKLGEAWGAEEQTDNTPDPEDEKNKGGLRGILGGKKSGKKRFAMGYSAPVFKQSSNEPARITRAAVWVDLWQGSKGTLKKTANSQMVDLSDESPTRIAVVFSQDQPLMTVDKHPDAKARTPKDLQKVLVDLWKQDAFGIKDS